MKIWKLRLITIISSQKYEQRIHKCIETKYNSGYHDYCATISYNVDKKHLGDYTEITFTYPRQTEYNFGLRHVPYNGTLFNITSYYTNFNQEMEIQSYTRIQNGIDITINETTIRPNVIYYNGYTHLIFHANYSLPFMTGPLYLDLLPTNLEDTPIFSYPFVPESEFTFDYE